VPSETDPAIVNYFTEESPGKGMAANVEDEKMKLLRLLASRGQEGIAIYDEAANRTNAATSGSKGEALNAAGVTVPQGVIDETTRNFDQSQAVFRRILAEQSQAARIDDVRRRSIEAIYKDSVIGAAPVEAAGMQREIDDYLKAKRAGSGGGGGDSMGPGYVDEPTIDASFLTPVDVEGLTPVASYAPNRSAGARILDMALDPLRNLATAAGNAPRRPTAAGRTPSATKAATERNFPARPAPTTRATNTRSATERNFPTRPTPARTNTRGPNPRTRTGN
jgi:hypothetical protein